MYEAAWCMKRAIKYRGMECLTDSSPISLQIKVELLRAPRAASVPCTAFDEVHSGDVGVSRGMLSLKLTEFTVHGDANRHANHQFMNSQNSLNNSIQMRRNHFSADEGFFFLSKTSKKLLSVLNFNEPHFAPPSPSEALRGSSHFHTSSNALPPFFFLLKQRKSSFINYLFIFSAILRSPQKLVRRNLFPLEALPKWFG